MSEVKRFTGDLMYGKPIESRDGVFVYASDFDRVTAERDAALAELSRAKEKIDKAWNRTTAIDHKGFIPGALDAWKRPVHQHLPYDFSENPGASATQYCNGWNDCGGYWSAHASELQQRLTAADELEEKNAALNANCQRHREEKYSLRARVDVLAGLLRNLDEAWNSHDGRELFGKLMRQVEAALKPSEGGGDEAV